MLLTQIILAKPVNKGGPAHRGRLETLSH